MDLREWTKLFLKQRDLLKREITAIEGTAQGFLVRRKDGSETLAIVQETLEPSLLDAGPSIISCLNTKENVLSLARDWQAYAAREELLLVFANPGTNEKWLLKPWHHGRVADEDALEQGLLAMHEAIHPA